MTKKTFIILAIAAVVSVAAAAASLSMQPRFTQVSGQGEYVFPGLLAKAAGVGTITIIQDGAPMTFELGSDGWTLAESGGYTIHDRLAAKVVLSLAELQLLEPKTQRKEKFAALRLEDPMAPKSRARLISLKDKAGKDMGSIVVGRSNFSLPAVMTGGQYVRRPDSEQTWLARGVVDIGVEPRDWLVREIMDVADKQIQRVTLRHNDGEVVEIVADAGNKHGFRLATALPEGKKLTTEYAPQSIATVPTGFLLNDVRRNGEITLPEAPAVHAEFELSGDVTITLTVWREKPHNWMRVAVHYTGSEPESDGAKLATALAKRTGNWIYDIPDYQADQMSKRLADLIEDAESGS